MLMAVALPAVVLSASPLSLLTVTPPVYHDEYNLLAPAVAFTEEGSLRMPLYDSTPTLERVFHGRGSFTPALSAGFYVGLGLWFDAVGVGIRQARMFVWILGLVVVAEVVILGWRWWNPWVGAAAGLLVALDGSFWYASRQVRPETFTMAAFLGAASLLSIADEQRRRQWAPLAGALFGLGLTGHPMGAVAAPVVILVPFVSGGGPDAHERRRFLLPALMLGLAYAAFLFIHREGVLANLRLHAEQRALGTPSLSEVAAREALRYGEGYWSEFAQGLGRALARAAWIGWGLLVVAAVVARARDRRSVEPGPRARDASVMAFFAAGPAIIMAGLAVLARDRNYLYLLHHLPWLFLAGAAGPVALARAVAPVPAARAARMAGALGAVALVVIGGLGVRAYRHDTAPQREAAVMSYEQVEVLLTRYLPEGALVIGNETAWLATRAARAQFVFAKQYVQYVPPYERYPVHSTFEGSHLTSYAFDLSLLREMDAVGLAVFYVLDMWDWAWNVYFPFGRYAGSYRSAQETLQTHFTPVLRIFTRDRGWIVLYRYGRAPGAAPPRDDVFVEGRRFALGNDLEPRAPVPLGAARPASAASPVAEWDLERGAMYWMHGDIAVEQGLVLPVWNDRVLGRLIDAPVAVPIDAIVRGRRGRLGLLPYPSPSRVRIDALRLRQLQPQP